MPKSNRLAKIQFHIILVRCVWQENSTK